ncbi:beta strand repeat-containing protein [Flavobacterium sp.]|uniref:beta strand repeat-containing protein n=1 Tax=Flavobacterium sp. TaxID=239 RepID=UPI00374DEC2D
MKKIIGMLLLCLSGTVFAQTEIITSIRGEKLNYNPRVLGADANDPSAAYDINSTTGGFLAPRMSTIQRDAIASPAVGLMIYNTVNQCYEFFQNTGWYNMCWQGTSPPITFSPTSGGSAVVTAFNCGAATAGTMTEGVPVSGVTQTITATVATVGTYSITSTANGVTFSGTGVFTGIGAQNIVLTATGTPAAVGTNSFGLSTTVTCNFNRTTIVKPTSGTSGGTAVVSAYTCSTASAGTLTQGDAVLGVTQTVTATVTSLGTYNITTTANGVTFAGAGTFTGTGSQSIVLTATGTPTAVGTNNFVLSTTPSCNFDRTTVVKPTSATSGGTAVVSAFTCSTASGGSMTVNVPVFEVKQVITATVTSVGTYNITATANGVTFAGSGTFTGTGTQNVTLTATGTPLAAGSNAFALSTTPSCSFDRTTIVNPTSGGTAAISEFVCGVAGGTGTLTAGVPASGVTQKVSATVFYAGTYNISTNTVNGVTFTGSGTLAAGYQDILLTATGTPTVSGTSTFPLATGGGVSCSFNRTTNAAGNATSGGTAVVSAYSCSAAVLGTMTQGIAVYGVSQTITATVTTVGTYNITSTVNGITFAGSGTFAGTGAQNIVLNGSGTPTAIGINSFPLGTTPACSFDRETIAKTGEVTGSAGKIWMDRNLGAGQVATTSNDYKAYGSLFQWGRKADGHQLINWTSSGTGTPVYGTTTTRANSDTAPNSLFILDDVTWRGGNVLVKDLTLWVGINGENNPCPTGFRIPSSQELDNEIAAAGITNSGNISKSPLKLTLAGGRTTLGGSLVATGYNAQYWTSDAGSALVNLFYVTGDRVFKLPSQIAVGGSVRCIKN